jgi:hypothetical protein
MLENAAQLNVTLPDGSKNKKSRRSSCEICLLRGRQPMKKRKPDLLWILVILFGLGVVTTGYTQSLWDRPGDAPVTVSQQP